MEYVGRRLRKEFPGRGAFFGLVQSIDPSSGLLRIAYDGGDFEELEFSEVASLLVAPEKLPLQEQEPSVLPQESRPRRPGRPRKRCHLIRRGKGDDSLVSEGDVCSNLVDKGGDCRGLDLNLNDVVDLSGDGFDCSHARDHVVVNVADNETKLHGLDLSNVGLDLNKGAIEGSLGVKREMIDLNVDVNEDFGHLHGEENRMCFDLNLQFMEDDACNLDSCVGQLGTDEKTCVEGLDVGANLEVLVNENGVMGNANRDEENKQEIMLKICENGVACENTAPLNMPIKRRGRKRKGSLETNVDSTTHATSVVDSQTGDWESKVTNMETPLKDGSDSVDYDDGNSSSALRGRRGRKRKDLSDNNNGTSPTPDMKLRRSSRRVSMATFYGQDNVFKVVGSTRINDQPSSPADSVVYDEKVIVSNPPKSWDQILPPKVELPPSSCDLDLDEVSVFEFLSVYAFLRSFSTLLFISPFQIDDFVASIKCNDSTLLFDSIHVSLLRAIRERLESLVAEGSVSASNCLRSLNWDHLDLITWPMFVVEYLLLHSPGYIPGIDLRHLRYSRNDYYRLPVSAKVEILHHLCDDVIETDAFRSEINRRTSVAERQVELDWNMKVDRSKRRKAVMDVVSTSCITEEEADEHTDWNSDECHLCKMDGNLICCDGCPAAFHSRCVGVASSLLPEGDWFCPECLIDKGKPWMKIGKSVRGAKLLGIDPYGRLYYSSCGYLLVLESYNDRCSFRLYNRNGLVPLIAAMDSCPSLYDSLISSICKQWDMIHEVGRTRNDSDMCSYSIQSSFGEIRQPPDVCATPSETVNEIVAEKKFGEKTMTAICSKNIELESKEPVDMMDSDSHGVKLEHRLASSEESTEVSQAYMKADSQRDGGLDCFQRYTDISDESQIPEKFGSAGNAPPTIISREVMSQVLPALNYINYYEFGRISSSVFEDVNCKLSRKASDTATKSAEEIITAQLQAVSNRSNDFCWANIQDSNVNSRKEKCGWCFYCKVPEEETNCLFVTNDCVPAVEIFTSEVLGIQSGSNRKKHLIDIICQIIYIEHHLHGLLSGPWINPHYSAVWRTCILEAANISSMKILLLKLEANLNHRALSADWRKSVDSVPTMGSAAHIVSHSLRASSKQGIGRKRAKGSELQSAPSSNAMTGLTHFWWRGGRGSRYLFNWKVLPHSLVSKAARQGGFKKITGILYPEGGEYAKRIKCDAWRAAVETSKSVEQLALQVRELHTNIKWDEIGKANLLTKMDSGSKKSARLFKKAIIRRKFSEGTVVKYLLDFGRRRSIPEIVVKQGSMHEDSTSQRKKYWLEEIHVPLHLLKAFEEKRIARKSNKMSFGKVHENCRIMRKPFKKKGFPYLFSRAERLESSLCRHCMKDVLIREAVSCQFCKGFFHKKHVQKSVGFTISVPAYMCHKCWDAKFVETDAQNEKLKLAKAEDSSNRLKPLPSGKRKKLTKKVLQAKSKHTKVAPLVITLRRSARNAERVSKLSLHNAKVKKWKKKKQNKSRRGKVMKSTTGCCHKMRTPVHSSYWLNGLQFSRRPNDERLMHFRSKMLFVASEEAISYSDKPKCSLCNELEYTPSRTYVACEVCGVWFHGDALDLNAEKIAKLIGYKCYKCLNKKRPACPYECPAVDKVVELMAEDNKAEIKCIGMDSNSLLQSDKKTQSKDESSHTSLAIDKEKQTPESVPENGLTGNENSIAGNSSVEAGEIKDLVFTDSAVSSSNLSPSQRNL